MIQFRRGSPKEPTGWSLVQVAQTTLSWDLLGSVCFGCFSMSTRISWSHTGSGAGICSAWGDIAKASPEDAIPGFLRGALQTQTRGFGGLGRAHSPVGQGECVGQALGPSPAVPKVTSRTNPTPRAGPGRGGPAPSVPRSLQVPNLSPPCPFPPFHRDALLAALPCPSPPLSTKLSLEDPPGLHRTGPGSQGSHPEFLGTKPFCTACKDPFMSLSIPVPFYKV